MAAANNSGGCGKQQLGGVEAVTGGGGVVALTWGDVIAVKKGCGFRGT